MKLSKPVLIALAAAILGLLGLAFWLLQPPGEAERRAAMAEMVKSYGAGPDGQPFPLAYNTDELDESVLKDGILNAARTGRLNLPAELEKQRAKCSPELTREQCDQSVRDFLYNLPEPDNRKLVELFNNYLVYEDARTKFPPAPGLGLLEKYELLKKKRREVFGAGDAALVFGLEEANFAYQETLRRFQSDEFAALSPDERLRKLQNARRDTFGDYFDTLREREPKGMEYGLDLMVRQTDLAKMPDAERQDTVHKLRVKYFGQEQADRITEREQNEKSALAAKSAKVDEFLKREAEINQAGGLSPAEKSAKIEELRKELIETP